MPSLSEHIAHEIRMNGPMDIGRYMSLCLGHPELGYYMTRDPFGVQGDFITAPEVSQVFGELIGAWVADAWIKSGVPDPFALVEPGPGRGTLMSDLLRATKGVQGFHEAGSIHFIEISPALKNAQSEAFRNRPVSWHDDLETLPEDRFMVVIGNEFLDALPVRQLIKTEKGWDEVMIGLDEQGQLTLGQQEAPLQLIRYIPSGLIEYRPGDVVEVSPVLEIYLKNLFQQLKKQSGFCLFIDYGYTTFKGEKTVQAVQKHRHVSILESPGACDLTAHVNFETVSRLALENGLTVHGPVTQKSFLERLGITGRIGMLGKNATDVQKHDLHMAYQRLCGVEQMGELFKVIGISSDPSLQLEGFTCA